MTTVAIVERGMLNLAYTDNLEFFMNEVNVDSLEFTFYGICLDKADTICKELAKIKGFEQIAIRYIVSNKAIPKEEYMFYKDEVLNYLASKLNKVDMSKNVITIEPHIRYFINLSSSELKVSGSDKVITIDEALELNNSELIGLITRDTNDIKVGDLFKLMKLSNKHNMYFQIHNGTEVLEINLKTYLESIKLAIN